MINGPCLLGWFDREGYTLSCTRHHDHIHTSHPPIHKHSTPTDLQQYENRGETVEHITALVRARPRMVMQCWRHDACDIVLVARVLGDHCLHDTRPSRICDPFTTAYTTSGFSNTASSEEYFTFSANNGYVYLPSPYSTFHRLTNMICEHTCVNNAIRPTRNA